tara:strand:- start:2600 stop:2962 length:363 start_codon:yes stop_codon:yes gene_type:complete
MMVKLVNLTNHDIVIYQIVNNVEKKVVIEPSKMWARMNNQSTEKVEVIEQDGIKIPIFEKSGWYNSVGWRGNIFGLPAPKKNTYYIVSRIVAQHNLDRKDLLIPESNAQRKSKYLYRIVM